jgi:hypothetical protein
MRRARMGSVAAARLAGTMLATSAQNASTPIDTSMMPGSKFRRANGWSNKRGYCTFSGVTMLPRAGRRLSRTTKCTVYWPGGSVSVFT